jgi:SPP1 gp7 family putative phage head morphogenesis protein
MNNAARKAYYVRFNRVHLSAENGINKALLAWLADQSKGVLTTFDESGVDEAIKRVESSFSESALTELFLEQYQKQGKEFRGFLLDNFNKPVEKRDGLTDVLLNISFFSQRFQNLVSGFAATMAAERVSGICKALRERLKATILNAASNNLSKADTAKEIKKTWGAISKDRARLIARTETTTIAGFAQMETAKDFTIKLDKVWIAARDSRTRPDHKTADGKRVKMEEDFDIGGVKMSHPGDPKGGAANCCNCRCTVAFVPQKEFGPLR